MSKPFLIVTCEHGGRQVPAPYAALFAGHEARLRTHRGWDRGALDLAHRLADAFGAPLFASTTTRLLIDLNRSIGHRELFSEVTRGLTLAEREQIVLRHYRPHRDAVEHAIGLCIARGARVIHIASHSFTPRLNSVVRRADVAWLYDPRRTGEATLARQWMAALAQRAPGLRLRRNYPYRGRADGIASLLRKRHPAAAYVGIELEVNQRFVQRGGSRWEALCVDLVESLAAALCDSPRRGYHASAGNS